MFLRVICFVIASVLLNVALASETITVNSMRETISKEHSIDLAISICTKVGRSDACFASAGELLKWVNVNGESVQVNKFILLLCQSQNAGILRGNCFENALRSIFGQAKLIIAEELNKCPKRPRTNQGFWNKDEYLAYSNCFQSVILKAE